ncbi:ECF subfamily RNA polymerase sigma-24 factor [Calothrix parasitica NIES-267]|uniref:ECF subfamily RNA polymerase sigma-24 factor n=1 Tax=Calothrix parasitica NIES-267 TaxID=1973488 RepID=A0A1Z4LZ52_9CYAN|nr:ECF subfamily RNA polymerase sigma-24 factor [Calothrix parasitica NIES-267]
MSDKNYNSPNNNILFQEVLRLVESLIMTKTGKHLSNIEVLVLRGSWKGHKYNQIATESGYTGEYIKNDIGPKLWKRLSLALEKKVTKNNFKAILEQYIYQVEKGKVISKSISNNLENNENFINTNNLIATPKPIYHNLPSRDYTKLVGREVEARKLLEILSFEWTIPCVSIEGIGGAGKTSLALDIAYRCLKASNDIYLKRQSESNIPSFELIVFTSAKSQFFTSKGTIPRLRREKTLVDIFTSIIRTVSFYDSRTASFEDTYEQIYKCLANMRTLLIIDNLDTLEEQQQVLSFLYELPPTVKALITSREKTPFNTVNLSSLTKTEALMLIQQQANEKQVDLDFKQCIQLYQTTGGIPAAIIYAISQIAAGYSFYSVTSVLMPTQGDFCRFYFESSVQQLKEKPAYNFLMALSLFAKPATCEALRAVAGVKNPLDVADGLAKLQQLSLINYRQGCYEMLHLTREYALSKMSNNPEFEMSARNRWVKWYVEFAQQHGGKDWREWQDYQNLEDEWGNLSDVIEWCIANNYYRHACKLWQSVKCYTYSFAYRQNRLSYWDAPLLWLEWLSEAAVSREDFPTAAQMIGERAWKLTLLAQEQHLALADDLYNRAWQLHQHLTLDMQVDLAIHIGVWYIQKQQFLQATDWLKRAKTLLNNPDNLQIDSSLATRLSLHILYYEGEIYYKTENYQDSKILFKKVFDKAQSIGWKRASLLAKDFLADIALKQGKLQQAQDYLAEVLQVAENNQDKCSRAYTKRSLARLEKKLGNLNLAKRWVYEAVNEFEILGMKPEARETQALIQTIEP